MFGFQGMRSKSEMSPTVFSDDNLAGFQDDESDQDYDPKLKVIAKNADALRHKCVTCKKSFRFEQSFVKHFKFCRF